MFYVGVDIAKLNHMAAVVSATGDVLIKPFPFTNTSDGFQKLLSSFSQLGEEEFVIGLESTAHYGHTLIEFLVSRHYRVCLLNPIQTAGNRKKYIRKTKTDSMDTLLIANTLRDIQLPRFVTPQDVNLLQLKTLGRFRRKLVKQRTSLKIQLTSYLDQVFPELQYFFKSGLHQKSCYALLKEAPCASRIASMHLTHLSALLSSASKGRFKKSTATELRILAHNSIGFSNSSLSLQVTQSIEQIELLNRQIHAVEEEMEQLMQASPSVIMSVPGIGFINGGMILGEIGTISRFSHPSKLLAFAGLDPSVYQSGNFRASHTRMSKRGSKTLRYALVNAAHNLVKNNQTFRDFYDKKMAEGRTHYNALGHCAGKLVRILYKLLSNNISFELA